MPNPTYSEFRIAITDELMKKYTFAINSTISGEYFIFYINTVQICEFKLILYDRLLKYQSYSGVYNYFYNYISSFINISGSGSDSGSVPHGSSQAPITVVSKKNNPRIIT